MITLLSTLVAACGGGGDQRLPFPVPTAGGGMTSTQSITARSNGTACPLYVYLPPDSVADRARLPVIYLLDGESRLQALIAAVESLRLRTIIVAIGNEALRPRDFVPANTCTSDGGCTSRTAPTSTTTPTRATSRTATAAA